MTLRLNTLILDVIPRFKINSQNIKQLTAKKRIILPSFLII